jgi:hypothetical protein
MAVADTVLQEVHMAKNTQECGFVDNWLCPVQTSIGMPENAMQVVFFILDGSLLLCRTVLAPRELSAEGYTPEVNPHHIASTDSGAFVAPHIIKQSQVATPAVRVHHTTSCPAAAW